MRPVDHQLDCSSGGAQRGKEFGDDTALFISTRITVTSRATTVSWKKTQNTFEECLVRVPFIVKPPGERARKTPGERGDGGIVRPVAIRWRSFVGISRSNHFGRSLGAGADGPHGRTPGHRVLRRRPSARRPTMELHSNPDNDPEHLYCARLSLQRSDGPNI